MCKNPSYILQYQNGDSLQVLHLHCGDMYIFLIFSFCYTDKDEVQVNGEAFACSVDEASSQGTLYIYGTYKSFKLYTYPLKQ